MPYRRMTEDERWEHVFHRLDAQDNVLATNSATMKRMEGLLDTFTALRVGGGFLKWLGAMIIAGLALMGYISHR